MEKVRERTGGRVSRVRTGLALAVLAVVLAAACATVPLTGRTQLSLVSDSTLLQMSLTQYQQVLSESKLSRDQRQVAMIRRVGQRIASATEDFLRVNGLGHEVANYKWEFNLIEDNETMNAWCMPGGKIAFYTGILPVCQDETGVAVVMGHEVAHAVAKHGNERMSQGLLFQLGGLALALALSDYPAETQQLFLTVFGVGATVGVLLPYSRAHEYEADRIGLTLMAKAGYDPRAAVGLWERMNKIAQEKGQPPEFLSTHPAPANRIEEIKRFLPEALRYYQAGSGRPRDLHRAGLGRPGAGVLIDPAEVAALAPLSASAR
ncbi:MAG: M48 family metallopeptidase [Thermodesulfobacteriota bacterium]